MESELDIDKINKQFDKIRESLTKEELREFLLRKQKEELESKKK